MWSKITESSSALGKNFDINCRIPKYRDFVFLDNKLGRFGAFKYNFVKQNTSAYRFWSCYNTMSLLLNLSFRPNTSEHSYEMFEYKGGCLFPKLAQKGVTAGFFT